VPELIAKTALAGQAPKVALGTTLAEGVIDRMVSIAPYPGREAAVDGVLAGMGLRFPAAGEVVSSGAARLIWAGRGMAFLIGADAPAGLADLAALTDQADGWAPLQVSGPAAVDALMRPFPMDLRAGAFPVGTVARAPLNHMQAVLVRTGADAFDVMVFRSMARTAWAEIAEALDVLEARAKAS
jgi:sarcosine oxidase subunit gamma